MTDDIVKSALDACACKVARLLQWFVSARAFIGHIRNLQFKVIFGDEGISTPALKKTHNNRAQYAGACTYIARPQVALLLVPVINPCP